MDITKYSIEELFTTYLPSKDLDIEIREEQITLAKNITHIFDNGGIYAVEAGTGIGKSFSYIVPALLKALEGKKVVIVTGTIALQHQLADKDLPRIQALLGTHIPCTVLKGKGNYLCKKRLAQLVSNEDGRLFSADSLDKDEIDNIMRWSQSTETGDKEELGSYVPKAGKVWSKISTHEFMCGGKQCNTQGETQKSCFYVHARRQAMQSNIIITNYSLLSYHLKNISDTEGGEGLLPEDAIYILDEAHNLMSTVRQSLSDGIRLSEIQQVQESLFGKNGSVTSAQQARGTFENSVQKQVDAVKLKLKEIQGSVESLSKDFIAVNEDRKKSQAVYPLENYETFFSLQDFDINPLLEKFRMLSLDFQQASDSFQFISELFDDGDTIIGSLLKSKSWLERMANISSLFSHESKQENIVRWVDFQSTQSVAVFSAPLFVNDFLSESFFKRNKHIICTSATITYEKKFDYWFERNGVPYNSHTDVFPSPFPYKDRVLMAIPEDAPDVKNEAQYITYLIDILPDCLDISEGRALILCTSKNMVYQLSTQLKKISKSRLWNIIAQDNKTTISHLASKFRQDKHSVLVGTASFWEGFDAPGDTLKMLVITRVPFPNPNDLFIKEESQFVEVMGKSAFLEVSMPQAELKLRQGFGRLMRSNSDGGVVFITDTRLYQTHKTLLKSLPECSQRMTNTPMLLQEMASHLRFIDS